MMKLGTIAAMASAYILSTTTTTLAADISDTKLSDKTAQALLTPASDLVDALTEVTSRAYGGLGVGASPNSDQVVGRLICPATRQLTTMVNDVLDLADDNGKDKPSDGLRAKMKELVNRSKPFQKLMHRNSNSGDCKMEAKFDKAISRASHELDVLDNGGPVSSNSTASSSTGDGDDDTGSGKKSFNLKQKNDNKQDDSGDGEGDAEPTVGVLCGGASRMLRVMRDSVNKDYGTSGVDNDYMAQDYLCPMTDDMATVTNQVLQLLDKSGGGSVSSHVKGYAQALVDSAMGYLYSSKAKDVKCDYKEMEKLSRGISQLESKAGVTPKVSSTAETAALNASSSAAVTASSNTNSTSGSSGSGSNNDDDDDNDNDNDNDNDEDEDDDVYGSDHDSGGAGQNTPSLKSWYLLVTPFLAMMAVLL